ncbi:TatD family hydrolase [Thalassotalea ganghwensis]
MAKLPFTDSHCHLDFKEFDANREALLDQCEALGIGQIIIPAVAPDNWEKVRQLTELINSPVKLYACVGIHPWYLHNLTQAHLSELTAYATIHQDTITAIGETGIDGKIAEQQNNLNKQIHFFQHHIALARELKLPLIIHHRKSHREIVAQLKPFDFPASGIIHAFSGSYQQAKDYLDKGFKLGIGGTITYERAKKTINTVKKLPLDSIVLETDAPAMPLAGFQGQINSPMRLIDVFEQLCQIRSESKEAIAQAIENNINTLIQH